MKTRFPTNRYFGTILFFLAAVVLPVKAQSNFVLHAFGAANYSSMAAADTNFDGIHPNGWLTWSGTKFYGTAQQGGTNGMGTLFATDTNGIFTLLYTFPKDTNYSGNTYGAYPNGGLVLSGTNLYGTTLNGGTDDNGVIFSIATNGTGITLLHTFSAFLNTNLLGVWTNADGAAPSAGLVMSGKVLFGTAASGGSGGNGVVFSCSNTTFKVLHHFTAGNYDDFGNLTNSDGANPSCQLLLLGTNLFGTTSAGGTNGYGTVFKVSTNGSNFAVLHHFDDSDNNGDHGAGPSAGLVLSGGTLFGTGGTVVYAVGTNGAGFTVLTNFGSYMDTANAISGLTVSNGTLYGSAPQLGTYGDGQIFALTTNGVGSADFHDFAPHPFGSYPALPPTNSDGYFPQGGLVLLNNALYGAAFNGGTNAVDYNRDSSGLIFCAPPSPVISSSQISGSTFLLAFQTFDGLSYTVQRNTSLFGTNWTVFTNFMGNSTLMQLSCPATNSPQLYFRVRQP
jgi:uncharacterized repeat protein (TIGR03803 family)